MDSGVVANLEAEAPTSARRARRPSPPSWPNWARRPRRSPPRRPPWPISGAARWPRSRAWSAAPPRPPPRPRCAASCARCAPASSAPRASCAVSAFGWKLSASGSSGSTARSSGCAASVRRRRTRKRAGGRCRVGRGAAHRGRGAHTTRSSPLARRSRGKPPHGAPAPRRCTSRWTRCPCPRRRRCIWPASTGCSARLLDLIDIDDGWEEAVEAALGEALQAVVVADRGAAAARSNRCRPTRERGGARARRSTGPTRVPAPAGGEPCARTCAAAIAACAELLDALLGGAVRVADVAAGARRGARPPDAVVVTADGDRFGPTGWRSAWPAAGATAAALEEAAAAPGRRRGRARPVATQGRGEGRVGGSTRAQHASRARSAVSTCTTPASRPTARHWPAARASAARPQTETEAVERTLIDAEERAGRKRDRIAELDELVPALEADEAAEAEAARARGEARARLDARAAAAQRPPQRSGGARRRAARAAAVPRNAAWTRPSGACRPTLPPAPTPPSGAIDGRAQPRTRSSASPRWSTATGACSRCGTTNCSRSAAPERRGACRRAALDDLRRRAGGRRTRARRGAGADAPGRDRRGRGAAAAGGRGRGRAPRPRRRARAAEAAELPPLPEGVIRQRPGARPRARAAPAGPDQPAGAGGVHRAAGAAPLPRGAARGRAHHAARPDAGDQGRRRGDPDRVRGCLRRRQRRTSPAVRRRCSPAAAAG